MLQVDPSRFVPPPKVTSAVVRLDVYPQAEVGDVTPERFDAVVRAAFGQRRKTLANALGATYGRPQALAALDAAGIDPGSRAAVVDVDGYRRLAAALYAA